MQSDYSSPLVSNSNPFTQASPLSGFKFSTIGHNPSLLERMSDGPRASFRAPSSDKNPSQVQNSASASSQTQTPFRPTLPQVLTVGAPLVERGSSVKPIMIQDPNYPAPAPPTSFSPIEPRNDVKFPQPLDQIRPSVFPDLQYPNPTPDIEKPLWESSFTPFQPVPMGQDISHHPQPPVQRSLPLPPVSVSNPPSVESGAAAETAGSSAISLPSQHSGVTTSTEPEQVRRPVEDLFRIASVREEGLAKRREIFDLRSGELSTFGAEASQAVQDLLAKTETLKHQAEEMRAQAEQTLQEATKMRDMADHLIQSADTLGVDLLGAKNQVGRAVERSEQVARYVQKSFDWLVTLRNREQEKVAAVQAEIAAQDLADLRRRQEELQRQLERRKIEEKEKIEAAKREEQEREAARKKAEEREVARMRAYDIRRAEVMAEKRRASEAQAQSIQERRIADSPGSSLRTPARGSNTPLSTTPAPTPEAAHNTRVSANSQVAVPTRSQSETTPSFPHPQPLPNKVKTVPAPVSFVPAQTEAGRAVNTDSPLSSTILASELHPRNVIEVSRHPHFNQVTHDTQEMQSPNLRPVAPPSEPPQVEVKREPSVGELPPSHPQSPPDMEYSDHPQHRQPAAVLRTASQDRDADQRESASSTSGSRATPPHVVYAEDYLRRIERPGSVPPQDDRRHLQDSSHDRVAPSTDERAYGRQESASSDLSVQRWNYRDRRSPSPLSSRGGRSRSRSPPYWRKRARSRTPPRFETRQIVDRWEPDRPRIRPRIDDDDWDRPRRYNGYDRGRQGDNSRRYRAPLRRGYNNYRPSRSPPPSPRQYRNERSPPRRSYHDRLLAAEHVPQRYVNTEVQERRTDEYRANVNARHHEPAYEETEAYRTTEKEEQQRLPQYHRERRTPSPSERDQTSTPSPRQGEPEIGLLDRINMNEADDRGPGRGRAIARGGPSTRRGTRGVSSSGRGRGGAPALLSRMSETTTRPTRPAPALSLSDRMQQD